MSEVHPNARLEAFSDGVFAIAITLLVIELRISDPERIHSNAGLWEALRHITPAILAFILSFTIILITWVNHHHAIKLVNKSSSSFIYANGFLLLTVAFIPFPTSLLGEFISTDHASPAVALYNITLTLQAVGWILITNTALNNHLGKSEKANKMIRNNGRFGYFATILYALLAVLAFWFPVTMAIVTGITWIFWLVYGISIKHEEA